jgi:hypothetical protein
MWIVCDQFGRGGEMIAAAPGFFSGGTASTPVRRADSESIP